MRHKVKGRNLSRTSEHRLALMRALSSSLIKHKRIKTTVQKAKELRKFVEPIITKAIDGSLHSKRLITRDIKQKEVYKALFDEVVPKVSERKGGYTRIVKLGNRHGDAAEMALIELVDFNDLLMDKEKEKKETKAQKKTKDNVEDAKVISESNEKTEKKSKPRKKKSDSGEKEKSPKKKEEKK